MDTVQLREKVETTYQAEVAALLPMNYEIVRVASSGIFVNRFPDHPMTLALQQVAARIMA
jgi:MinD-like ATPase involved in chromosome partitioning or flagellar assembly